MGRPVHFEIQADDLERAKAFYEAVFGWRFEDYSGVMNSPYFGVITGEEGEPGINGGLQPRPAPAHAGGTNAAVLTMAVEDFDATAEAVLAAGGRWRCPSSPFRAWPGRDTSLTRKATPSASTRATPTRPDKPCHW